LEIRHRIDLHPCSLCKPIIVYPFTCQRREAEGHLPEPASAEFLRWLHSEFYREVPESTLWIDNGDRGFRIELGEFRSQPEHDVSVGGRHIPPRCERVDEFMRYCEQRYRLALMGKGQIIEMAASHHRLAYIRPFPDDNGRVSRFSYSSDLEECLDRFLSFINRTTPVNRAIALAPPVIEISGTLWDTPPQLFPWQLFPLPLLVTYNQVDVAISSADTKNNDNISFVYIRLSQVFSGSKKYYTPNKNMMRLFLNGAN